MDHFQQRRSVPKMTANWQLINHLFPLVLGTSAEISYCITSDNPDLGSASDWLSCVENLIQQIRITTQIWVVTRHQYGISALVYQASFGAETTAGSIDKCRLFSQAITPLNLVTKLHPVTHVQRSAKYLHHAQCSGS